MNQFEDFLSYNNFLLSFKRLKTAQRNLYKSIYYDDLKIFELFLGKNLNTLIHQIRNNTYKPDKSQKIFIPKKNNLVRPLSALHFNDLIVYQALTNIIADNAYDKIAPYYGKSIFGNIINPPGAKEKDKIFFYKPWKKGWRLYSERTLKYYNDGYIFMSEFDIASFFDTIDHKILSQILTNHHNIEEPITELLTRCLESWTADYNHKTFNSSHGIPQGPVSSPFLADLYLFYLDREITSQSSLKIKYFRYVDDIRILSKDAHNCNKAIAALDLISRDLGLIPQGNKIFTKEIENIHTELKTQNSKFSSITHEFKINNNSITTKTHNKLKKRFLRCFQEDGKNQENYLDKTVIGFSLFKLNKDDEVKDTILRHYQLILIHFEAILFYLKKHYSKDKDIKSFLYSIIGREEILFHHTNALIFKFFSDIDFDEAIFTRYASNKNRYWLVRYYMIDWLYMNGKCALFEQMLSCNDDNYFIQRKINDYKFINQKDITYRKLFVRNLLSSTNNIIALHGLNLSIRNLNLFLGIQNDSNLNQYIKNILGESLDDYITETLRVDYEINNPSAFFNQSNWKEEKEYIVLSESLIAYEKLRNNEPSIAILNLNTFNNLCFNKICILNNITYSPDYGKNLSLNEFATHLPITSMYWTEINTKRNQKTEAHPYDKYGKIRVKITKDELKNIHLKEIESLKEICLNYIFDI